MKRKYKLFQVDSFTDKNFSGNPAGVILNADVLTDEEMQQIAKELNNSETAFILSPTESDHEVWIRYFTPTTEVPTCGHATIAAHYVRAKENGITSRKLIHKIGIGKLPIEIVAEDGDLKILMTQGRVEISEPLDGAVVNNILEAIGLSADDFNQECPVQIVSTGSTKVIIGIKNAKALNSLSPSFSSIKEISKSIGCIGFFPFTFDTGRKDVLTTARMFAPAIGINEDPVTGNGNGPLGAYLVHNNLAGHNGKMLSFRGEQGVALGRPGYVDVDVTIDNGIPVKVVVGGRAVIVFQTEIEI